MYPAPSTPWNRTPHDLALIFNIHVDMAGSISLSGFRFATKFDHACNLTCAGIDRRGVFRAAVKCKDALGSKAGQ